MHFNPEYPWLGLALVNGENFQLDPRIMEALGQVFFGTGITRFQKVSQAEYDAIVLDPPADFNTTIYFTY